MSTEVQLENVSPTIGNTMLSDAVFRPMLFSTPMVQAILEGRKTQTRRIVKFPKDYDGKYIYQNGIFGLKYSSNLFGEENPTVQRLYPKMELGNIIWVRETWQQECEYLQIAGGNWSNAYLNATGNYIYKADDVSLEEIKHSVAFGKWKPSLFMPRSACRLFLEITDIKAERLQDISENDAIEEGIEFSSEFGYKLYSKNSFFSKHLSATDSYMSLWESINGKDSWQENPFVWVYTFKVVGCPNGFR
jgi:hypothetical protein